MAEEKQKRIAVYAGTFDPITNGHIDIARRACKLFDVVYMAVAASSQKVTLFSVEQRVELIKEASKDADLNVLAGSFDGLLVDYVKEVGAEVIVRGLRAVSDYEYEYRIALVNRRLAPSVETISLMAADNNSYINSSIVRDVAKHGGDVSSLVPANVAKKLKETFKN